MPFNQHPTCLGLDLKQHTISLCDSRKYPYTLYPPHGRSLEILRGWEVSRATFFKERQELNWNFWRGGGGGLSKKTFHGGLYHFLKKQIKLLYSHVYVCNNPLYLLLIMTTTEADLLNWFVEAAFL